ncbi:MAG: AAA family ATPase [Deltaproteobacteria bacterium]|nr:AAA family ATPase [Deltaproteobacteria bacterium]
MSQTTVPRELLPGDLGPQVDPAAFPFATTADVEPQRSPLGQERALRSLRLGTRMRAVGYNVYVSGLSGNRKEALLKELVASHLPALPPPPDWVYLFNFKDPDRPKAVRLEPGQGAALRRDLEQLVETLKRKIPEAFRQETFEQDKDNLSKKYDAESKILKERFETSAQEKRLLVQPTPQGQLLFIPLIEGKPIEDAAQFEALPEEEKARYTQDQETLGYEARDLFKKQHALMEALQAEVEQIVKVYAGRIVDPLTGAIAERYPNPRVAEYLKEVRDYTLENLEKFKEEKAQPQLPFPMPFMRMGEADRFLEYRVNVLVDNEERKGAPVLVEESPTHRNLFGVIEKVVDETGKLVTNFTRIKAGKLLQASGGYLIFNLDDAITEPFVWKSLKRVLRSGLIEIESYQPLSFLSVAGLMPEPLPVNTRVIVHGSPLLFQLLRYWDPEFAECFKVVADFDYETDRNGEGVMAYAQRIAHVTRSEDLPPFDRDAVAEVLRFGARQVEHKERITARLEELDDLVREAAFFAQEDGAPAVTAAHIQKVVDDRTFRWNRIEEKIRRLIEERTILVTVDGTEVGQVNGLAVLSLGEYAFGRPSRVTASVGAGTAGLVNIEREARLSGSTHDKGVLILAGFLRNRFGRNRPLAFTASIAFEQSYGGIDGDSASSTELYALLSRLGDLPLRQDLAVTGSVNQLGEIQAIGGVNEKIEGFYRVCKAVGLTGRQGVLIPDANVRHLVLHPEVVDAVREGRFHIYPVRTVDEGMTVLTGLPAGQPGEAETVNGRVDEALEVLDRRARERGNGDDEKAEKEKKRKKEEADEAPSRPEEPPKPPSPPETRG